MSAPAMATITGKFPLPDGSAGIRAVLSVRLATEGGVAKYDNEVRSGLTRPVTVQANGTIPAIQLPISVQPGLEPSPLRYIATLTRVGRAELATQDGRLPKPFIFTLEGDTTWAELYTEVSDAPVTPSVLAEAIAARDDAIEAAAAAQAGGALTDEAAALLAALSAYGIGARINLDVDGRPYYDPAAEGDGSVVFVDADNTPYFDTGAGGIPVVQDVDAVPYLTQTGA